MYRHVLVPVDGTQLSTDTAAQAVALAAEVNARLTFLYATPDFSATSDGALLLSMSPEEYLKHSKGDTGAILAEVAELAKAKNIEYETLSVVSDRPYEAIVETAKKKGCDLIFMSSHGERGIGGLLRGSQTEKVLHISPIAVCVAAVESNITKGAKSGGK